MATGKPWSDREVHLAVQMYLHMLDCEKREVRYSKAACNRVLIARLDGRSRGSVEMKMMNISAAAVRLGVEPIPGYKPYGNIQKSLLAELERQAEGNQR